MATQVKVIRVSVPSGTVDYSNPMAPVNDPAKTRKDLADAIMAAIADTSDGQPNLSSNFSIVSIEKVAGGVGKICYELIVEG